MKLTKLVVSAVLLLVFPLSGCSAILGIEEKHLAAEQPAPTTCPLLADAEPAIRIMNAIPNAPTLDVCHRKSGEGAYGPAWFASNPTVCGTGVAYTEYTRNLAIKSGSYDFKLIPAGSKCDAAGIEVAAVEVAARSSLTLMAYGSSLAGAAIAVLGNYTDTVDAQRVRLINALDGAQSITAGILNHNRDAISPALFQNVPFGATASPPVTASPLEIYQVDPLGYVGVGGREVTLLTLDLGITRDSDPTVFLTASLATTPGHVYTAFALGNYGQTHPVPKIWTCDETEFEGMFLKCGNPVRVAFEVFNPNLADAFTPFITERKGPAVSAILSEDADLLCVTELFDDAIGEQLKQGASSVFRYRVFSDDVTAPVIPLTLTEAGLPPVYPPVACPADLANSLNSWIQCVSATPGCSVVDPVTNEHQFASPGFAATNCMFSCGADSNVYDLLMGFVTGVRPEAGPCYWCALTHLASYESFEHTAAVCSNEVAEPDRSHLAFHGRSGLAVFSRDLPLGEPELVLLPSSGWQRAALRVPVTLANGAVIDYWCGSVRYPNTEPEMSYAGPYAPAGTQGSTIEQGLELTRLVGTINQRSAATGIPAVVAIADNTSPEILDPSTGAILIQGLQPQNFAMMSGVWDQLVAPNSTPACTFCGDPTVNPLNSFSSDVTNRIWTTHLFGIGIDPSTVESTSRTFMQPLATIEDAEGNPIAAPISQHFGLRSVVKMTQ